MTNTHAQHKLNRGMLLGLALVFALASGCTIEQATAHHRVAGLGMSATSAPGGDEAPTVTIAPATMPVTDTLVWGFAATAAPVDYQDHGLPVIAGARPAPPERVVIVIPPMLMPSGLTATAAPTGTVAEERVAAAEEFAREREHARQVSSESVAGAAQQHDTQTEP